MSILSLALIGILPLGLMALSMAWFKITGKDGWPIMVGAGLAWLAMGAYGFSKSTAAWDIYQTVGAISMAMLLLCVVLSYAGAQARQEQIQAKLKVEVQPPKSWAERYADYEKRSGFKSQRELDEDANARFERRMRRRTG